MPDTYSRRMEAYRTPDERFEHLPDWPFEARYLLQDRLRMHFVAEGDGDPVLLLHGEPTWSFLYRGLIPTLTSSGRVVAPDLFGFGRSDKPLRTSDYSFEFHYRSIERFALELELRRLTIVVHGWGGPIGFRLAVDHPDRVERLVVLNTGIDAGRPPSHDWLRFELVRRAGTDLVPSRLVRASCVSAPDDAVPATTLPFPGRRPRPA